jgi:hypothetical protein
MGTFWLHIPRQSPKSLAATRRALHKSEESQSHPQLNVETFVWDNGRTF